MGASDLDLVLNCAPEPVINSLVLKVRETMITNRQKAKKKNIKKSRKEVTNLSHFEIKTVFQDTT